MKICRLFDEKYVLCLIKKIVEYYGMQIKIMLL